MISAPQHTVAVPPTWYSNKTEIHPGAHQKMQQSFREQTGIWNKTPPSDSKLCRMQITVKHK